MKKIIYIIIFLFVTISMLVIYNGINVFMNNDSVSYTYLLGNTPDIYTLQRPPVYPLFLLLIEKISLALFISFYDFLFYFQVVLFSSSIVILTSVMYKFSKNIVISSFFLLLCISYLYLSSFQAVLAPETLLFFFISINLLIISLNIKKTLKILLLGFTLVLLTFTKPIFIFFPFFLIPFFILLKIKDSLIKKKDLFLLLSVLLTYLLLILSFSFYNYKKFNSFVFSEISQINSFGKVLQYDLMCTKEYCDELNSQISMHFNLKNPWIIEENSRVLNARQDLFIQMRNYTKGVLLDKGDLFLLYSVFEIDEILTQKYTTKGFYHDHYLSKSAKGEDVINSFLGRMFFSYQKILWSNIVVFVFFILSYFQFFFLLISPLRSIKSRFHLYCFFLVTYYILIISVSAYEQYLRLRAPIDPVIWILVLLSLDNGITFVKRKISVFSLKKRDKL